MYSIGVTNLPRYNQKKVFHWVNFFILYWFTPSKQIQKKKGPQKSRVVHVFAVQMMKQYLNVLSFFLNKSFSHNYTVQMCVQHLIIHVEESKC